IDGVRIVAVLQAIEGRDGSIAPQSIGARYAVLRGQDRISVLQLVAGRVKLGDIEDRVVRDRRGPGYAELVRLARRQNFHLIAGPGFLDEVAADGKLTDGTAGHPVSGRDRAALRHGSRADFPDTLQRAAVIDGYGAAQGAVDRERSGIDFRIARESGAVGGKPRDARADLH